MYAPEKLGRSAIALAWRATTSLESGEIRQSLGQMIVRGCDGRFLRQRFGDELN
jgi:hypothetical protein